MKRSIFAVLLFIFAASASANCGNGNGNGNGCEGSGSPSTPSTATSTSTSGAAAIAGAGAISGSAAISTSGNSSGTASASNGPVSNSVTTGNVRALSLGAAAVGSPANNTCAAHVAIGFGLATFPVTLSSCAALQEALVLDGFGLRKSAIQRLCQIKEVSQTEACGGQKPADGSASNWSSKENG